MAVGFAPCLTYSVGVPFAANPLWLALAGAVLGLLTHRRGRLK